MAKRLAIASLLLSARPRLAAAWVRPPAASTRLEPSSARRALTCRASPSSVIIHRGKARLFREGNPLVYGGAVKKVEGGVPAPGDVVDVRDASGKFIAWGVYNPDSMYRVRILARDGDHLAEGRDVPQVLRERLRAARAARRALGLPNEATDAYRCVNGEGDRLSGLVVDILGGVVAVSSSALWVELQRPAIEAALREEFGPGAKIVWRPSDGRLQQDGWKASPRPAVAAELPGLGPVAGGGAGREGAADGDEGPEGEERGSERVGPGSEPPPRHVIKELGIKYLVQPHFGQKTGFYCDQRESRASLRGLSSGKSVLDMFCFSGGFALNALAGGAEAVVAVDSSQVALAAAEENARLNGLGGALEEGRLRLEKGDALAFMGAAAERGESWDIVVLDPPKLAPNKKSLARATGLYRRLNAAALRLVVPGGGLLLTYTCSAAMTQSGGFVGVVQDAAEAAGRTCTLLRAVGPAADHAVNPCYQEGAYLTGALFYVT